jgi:hypothetical protein
VETDFKAAKKEQKMTSMSHTERILRIVWLKWVGSDSKGSGWIIAMIATTALQAWLMGKVASTHAALNSALHSRSGAFRSLLYKNMVLALAFGQTFVKQTVQLCMQRLGLVWRPKLTFRLHKEYFSNLTYYHLVLG